MNNNINTNNINTNNIAHPNHSLKNSQRSITNLVSHSLANHQSDIREAIEDISLIMGSKYKDMKLNSEKNKVINQIEILKELIEKLNKVDPVQLENLLLQFKGSEKSNNPLLFLQQAGASSSQIALICGYYIANKNLSKKAREKFKNILMKLFNSEKSLNIELFGLLDLGSEYNNVAHELKSIYQDAYSTDLSLIELFEKLKDSKNRKKKIKVLIKAIAFELSSEGEVLKDERLIITLKELKRLLLFFSVDMQCLQLSNILSKANITISTDSILEDLFYVLEQSWLTIDWVEERHQKHMIHFTIEKKIIYIQNIRSLLKHVPEQLFKDDDQKKHALEIYTNLVDLYADEEE